MPRSRPARLSRSSKVRTDADLLTEGVGEAYGWVSNGTGHGPISWGDWYAGGAPQWWLGSDSFDGSPIGPNGPGAGYGADPRARIPHGGWWNRPSSGAGLLPAVTRCTEIISQPIIRTPWVVETPQGPHKPGLWLADPMLAGSAPGDVFPTLPAGRRLTGHAFWSTVLVHALWWGRGAFIFVEASDGQPLAGSCMILNPFMLDRLEDGRWVINPSSDRPVVTDFDGRWSMGGKPWRVAAMRGLPPHDDATPEGVLSRHFDVLRLGAAVNKYIASTFASGVPSGFLKVSTPNATQQDLDAVRDAWRKAHGTGSRQTAVLNATVDYTPVSINPVDADAQNMAQLSRIDVAHAFGLSAAWLDSGDTSNTYANISDRRRDLVDVTLAGWGRALMETLSSLMPYGTTLRIAWQMFTAPDITAQIPVLVQAVDAGIITTAEARGLMGMDVESQATENAVTELVEDE